LAEVQPTIKEGDEALAAGDTAKAQALYTRQIALALSDLAWIRIHEHETPQHVHGEHEHEEASD
jgi:hypothetical protein